MKILYISPYRQSNSQKECINNIKALKKISNINIYPIYFDNDNANPDKDILDIEKLDTKDQTYDIVIQHAPIDFLVPLKGIAQKNYCIPLISYSKGNSADKYHKLLDFDSILVDSKYDSDFINNLLGAKSKKIKLFSYTNSYKEDRRINLLHHNNFYKLYTFVNENNIYYIKDIIYSFILSLKEIDKCSLIIVTHSKEIAEKINTLLDTIVAKANINYIKNYIKIVVPSNTIDDVIAIHRSCNCLIEIRTNTNSYFHTFMAKELNNSFIINENLNIEFEPIFDDNYDLTLSYPCLKISHLANKIKSVVRTQPIHKLDNIPTLDKII